MRLRYEKYIDRLKRCIVKLSLKYLFTRNYDRTILVAEDMVKNRVVGAALLSNVFEDTWSLDIIVVEPKLRLHGIGRKILGEVVCHVKSRGGRALIVSVTPDNVPAIRMYSKFNFKEAFHIVQLELDILND
jgi:ribosomal protein S18 acetylase RimI-like enzyme